jgi:CHASE2 domain-containing sensor protein/signal transduction histidine kinase
VSDRLRHIRQSGLTSHVIITVLLMSMAGLFVHQEVLWRWDNLLYDAQLSMWTRPVGDDIIIVAIDDESLRRLGRWPWPRSTHAQLIDILSKESPRAIGLDIIFSEPDHVDPVSDQLLSESLRRSGKVVLPIFMARHGLQSYPVEALPLAEFTRYAAALGHVHIDIGQDGIARRIFLREGIGEPRWSHYSLALLEVSGESVPISRRDDLSGAGQSDFSPMQWSRLYPYLIPYAGPPGHVTQIGYSQVLEGNYSPGLFNNKIVLVGTTAEGMGDALPTPLSGTAGIMPGVEIVANVVDALRQGLGIVETDRVWTIGLTMLLVALPMLLYPFLKPTTTLMVLFGIALATLLMAALLMWLAGIWLAVATAVLFQLLSYPLWSWRRLDRAMRHINLELDQLSERLQSQSLHRQRNLAVEMDFLSLLLPIKGWVVQDAAGDILKQGGVKITPPPQDIPVEGWWQQGQQRWGRIVYFGNPCLLGLSLATDSPLGSGQIALLSNLLQPEADGQAASSGAIEDLFDRKVKQVRAAGSAYEQLRRIVDDSLSGMADGIVICDSHGQVLLSNLRASWYLFHDDHATVTGRSFSEIMSQVELNEGKTWADIIKAVLYHKERVLAQARLATGRDLMVELSPLRIAGEEMYGFILNLSDISLLKTAQRKRNEVLDFLSHDLRAPLSSMLAMIELARRKETLDDMLEMLSGMERHTHKTLHLAEQFLQLSRATTDSEIRFFDIDFISVTLNAIDRLWALSSQLGIKIEYHFSAEECWTHADADLLERALINLLSNAINHSQKGSEVNVVVNIVKDTIECCVIDSGSGIESTEIPHLFEMFRRIQGAGVERKQGVGLGLAFVDAVIKRHGGQVSVHSEPGKGSRFCFTIPRLESVQMVDE